MAAEVSGDLTHINDEDQLRRMWADTEDFGRKKEIRARMYKIREQRLKDFYTTGDVVTEVTSRKHNATKTHADSISDQGFITMKTKEIRDSESPTRDFSIRAGRGNGYWNSRQENTYATGTDDGASVEMKSNVIEGQGTIREGNKETQMVMAAHNLQESSSKADENMSSKTERASHASKVESSSKTDTGDIQSSVMKSAREQSSQMKTESSNTTTSSNSSTTKWSTSSSSTSKKVTSSTSSQKYQISSGQDLPAIRDVSDRGDYRAITQSEDDANFSRRFTDTTQNVSRLDDSNQDTSQELNTTRVVRTSNTNRATSQNVQDSSQISSSTVIYKTAEVADDQNLHTSGSQIKNEKRIIEQSERFHDNRDVKDDRHVDDSYTRNVITRDTQEHDQDVVDRHTSVRTSDTRKFITSEQTDSQDVIRKREDNLDNSRVVKETRLDKNNTDDLKQSSSRLVRTSKSDVETSSAVTDQKIMKEIHKLDTYLSSQTTPGHSTPASPHVVTDSANWTVVSSKDGEFVYKGEKPVPTRTAAPADSTPKPAEPSVTPSAPPQETVIYPSTPADSIPKDQAPSLQPREKIVKHPSTIDLPREPTDGQYVTTYQQSYNRISVDNSPSHEFFASTLRASPDRSTPSPTKRIPSRGSLDRSTPERRQRVPSRGSLDRSSPETKPRKGSSSDRTSPERKYKPTPINKTPEPRRSNVSSYNVDKSKDNRKKTTDTSHVKDNTTKTRRKFSSTQTKTTTKARASTPGTSPSASPTRKFRPKDTTTTTDSDSDVSHGTYNKSTTNLTTEDVAVSHRQERTTAISKQDVRTTDQKTITNKDTYPMRFTPRDKSPEYSSEGSVSREIKENRLRDLHHETSPERRAFAPIRPSPTTVEEVDVTVNVISNEKRVISDQTDEARTVTEDQRTVTSGKKPVKPDYDDGEITSETDSSIIRREEVRVTDIKNIKSQSPYSSVEILKEKSLSPERRVKSGSKPPSSSPSPDRALYKQKPSSTSNRVTTTKHETNTFIKQEKRQTSADKSPDRAETRSVTRRRSSKETADHLNKRPSQQSKPRTQSPIKQGKSPAQSPERCSPSRPSNSPTSHSASVSPDRPSTTRRPQQAIPQRSKPTSSPTRSAPRHVEKDIPRSTTTTTTRKVQKSTEINRTPRKSSIPRTESFKPSPKSQTPKEIISRSPIAHRKPQTILSSPQKPRTPLIERTVVTVAKTSTVTNRKPGVKPTESPTKPVNATVRRTPTTPKKLVSPVASPKVSPTTKKENIPTQRRPKETTTVTTKITKDIRNTSNQKENKRPTKPVQGSKVPTSPNRANRNINTKTTIESREFIEHEQLRDTSDIEDECPPEEFYADLDDDLTPKQPVSAPKTSQPQNLRQTKTQIVTTTDRKDSRLKPSLKQPTSKKRQVLKESTTTNKTRPDLSSTDSSSDYDEEVTEEVIIEENLMTNHEQINKEKTVLSSNQDLLNVIVQLPKSSRESSPGYPSARIPVCSASEDGESNPRYADFIDEPEDSDNYDKKPTKRITTEPLYVEKKTTDVDIEETEVHTSVADRVTGFLEAAKHTLEPQDNTTHIEIDNTKSVLEAKTLFENIAKSQTTVQVSSQKPINIYEAQPEVPASKKQPSLAATQKPHKPENQIKPTVEPSKPKQKPVISTKDSFIIHEQQILEEEEENSKRKQQSKPQKSREASPEKKEPTNKQPMVSPEMKEPKQPLDRRPSGATISVSSKKDFFEKKAQNVNQPKTPSKDSSKPQKETPKTTKLDDSVSSVHDKTESYLRSTIASAVRSQSPDKTHRKDSKPDDILEPSRPESVEPDDTLIGQAESSYLRSTVASTVRSQTPEKPYRRDSKPDILDKSSQVKPREKESPTRVIDTGRKTSKPEEITRRPSKPEEITRRPSKPEEITRKSSKPEEITRKSSKPEERNRKPSKPEEITRKSSKPEEISRRPSKPEEITRKSSKPDDIQRPTKPRDRSASPLKSDGRMASPTKVIDITKKSSVKPDDTPRRPSKPDSVSPTRVKDVNTVFKQSEQTVKVNKEGKFGVTLRKTPSSTKVTTVTTVRTASKKPVTDDELPDVEDIFDLELLEELLLQAVGYDERRRIRAQIRIVKKQLEEEYNTPGRVKTTTTRTTYTTTIPSVRDIKAQSPKLKPDHATPSYERTTKVTTQESRRQVSSPERHVTKSPERRFIDTKTTETVQSYRKETSPKRETPVSRRPSADKQQPQKVSVTTSDRRSPERKSVVRQQKTLVEERRVDRKQSDDRQFRPDSDNAAVSIRSDRTQMSSRDSRSEVYESSTTVRSQTYHQVTTSTSDSRAANPTDSITSSYGVGPTDENGRPLFGLKALRRTNTNQSFGDNELEEQDITEIQNETEEIYDSKGRPLFGLKALQATTVEDSTMPAQTAQLRELVEKHQQYARESSAKEIKPVQKPKAKLRDSFILTNEDDQTTTGTTTTTTITTSHPSSDSSATGGLSLKSIIKKHEQVSSSTGGKVESEMESRSTVVHSQSTMSSDGKVSHKKNVIHGEISSKNGETPVGKITQKTYSYQTPDDKSLPTIISTVKTSTIGGSNVQRRLSGPKIEEIKDEDDDVTRRSIEPNRRYSKEYTVDENDTVLNRNEIRRRSSEISEESSRKYQSILKAPKQDSDWNTSSTTTTSSTTVRRTSGPKLTEFTTSDDGLKSKTTTTTTTTTKSVTDDNNDIKRTLSRGDSVKALQHKFQQATESANQSASRVYPPAGLILRSNSLQKNNDDPTLMSSTMKQSNIERTDSRGRVQETKARDMITSSPVTSTQVNTLEDSHTVRTATPTTVTTRVTMVSKSPIQQVSTSKVTEVSTSNTGASSFLDDTTKVTGVQDILNRMRNADLVSEPSDSTEDAEARSLLNKFLGASVILQGMEQGMRANQHHASAAAEAPSSAALVIQAEKQRVKDANIRTPEDDIDEISDEKQLRILLEACSDYEGRRKIRARLRTIMADHKEITDSNQKVAKDGDEVTKTEVHTTRTTTSTARLTKANSVQSPFAKFKQMERQNSAPSVGRGAPPNIVTEPKVVSSVSYVKEHLLNWVQAQTRGYKNVQIENFSTSWSDGLAFCALIHHFCPNAFDYNNLSAQNRRHNFELAFRVAEEEDIYPLLDVEDMVTMRKPDWKCVFTYVQSVYRRYQNSPDALPANPYV